MREELPARKPSENQEVLPAGMSLGVVGHRLDKLSDRDVAALQEPVRHVFGHLAAAQLPPDRQMVVVTSLAEGADRLVASEAIRRGLSIVVVLPFEREVFRADCSNEASREELDRLLAQASDVIEPASGAAPDESGYYWASMLIVESSDVLIAIWDGERGRGPGGTADTVDEAQIADIPVIWVLSHAPYSIDIVDPPTGLTPDPLHRTLASLATSQHSTLSKSTA